MEEPMYAEAGVVVVGVEEGEEEEEAGGGVDREKTR
jgi:hypothetical protein